MLLLLLLDRQVWKAVSGKNKKQKIKKNKKIRAEKALTEYICEGREMEMLEILEMLDPIGSLSLAKNMQNIFRSAHGAEQGGGITLCNLGSVNDFAIKMHECVCERDRAGQRTEAV